MKSKLVFDLDKLASSQTFKAYKEDLENIASSLYIRLHYMSFDKGKGVFIKDPDGNEYLDFTSSGCVANTGYCHPRVVEAIKKQAEKLTCQGFCLVPNKINNELAKKLIRITPGKSKKKVWFGCTGSDANDLVYKMVPEYKKRKWIVSFTGSYHGQTMGSYSLTWHQCATLFRRCPGVMPAPYPNCYRCPFGLEYPKCNLCCANYLEEHILRTVCPAEDVACIHLELIQGDGGHIVPPDDWVIRVKRICEKYDILFSVDEVRTGFGRTGKWFATDYFDKWKLTPDLMILGKPLASGVPLSAVVGLPGVLDFAPASNLYTLGGSPIPVAAAIATIDVIEQEDLARNAYIMGELVRNRLKELQKEYEIIGDVRGRGLFSGVEFVKDRKTKEPAGKETHKMLFRCWQLGLNMLNVGTHSNVFDMTPPLIITREQTEKGLQIIEQSIKDVLAGKVSDATIEKFAGW